MQFRSQSARVALLAAALQAVAGVASSGWICRMDGGHRVRETKCCPLSEDAPAAAQRAFEAAACCDAFSRVAARDPAEAPVQRNAFAPSAGPAVFAAAFAPAQPAPVPAPVAALPGAPPGAAPPLYLSTSSLLI
jgi:hypothetical protein